MCNCASLYKDGTRDYFNAIKIKSHRSPYRDEFTSFNGVQILA